MTSPKWSSTSPHSIRAYMESRPDSAKVASGRISPGEWSRYPATRAASHSHSAASDCWSPSTGGILSVSAAQVGVQLLVERVERVAEEPLAHEAALDLAAGGPRHAAGAEQDHAGGVEAGLPGA